MSARLHGLYAITDSDLLETGRLLESVEAAIAGGAAVVQYRDKSADGRSRHPASHGTSASLRVAARREREARALLTLCRSRGVLLIVNDDVALARTIGADGVHVGRDDAALHDARRALGKAAIIGVSCYNEFDLALAAQQAGANYVAFGRFFVSRTKPGAVRAELELIRQAKARLAIPVVAIGGITPHNAAPLVEAGVDMLAVVHGIFGQADPEQAARRYTQLFNKGFDYDAIS